MARKVDQVGKYWGESKQVFSSYGFIDTAELRDFYGTHPKIMEDWILTKAEREFAQEEHFKPTRRDYRNRIRFWLEEFLNTEISKKHYIDLGR